MDPTLGEVRLAIGMFAPQLAVDGEAIQSWGRVPEVGAATFFRTPSGYLLRFAGIADFMLSDDGAAVECRPARAQESGATRACCAET